MNINELINIYEKSVLDEETKNKRILILNTEIKRQEYEKNISNLINQFILEFNSSGLDYELELNLKHMLILLKGDILESDFCKKLESQNIEFTIEELEKYIYQEEIKGENLDDIKLNIKLYKMLDNINEEYKDLKSILENTINIVLDNNINNLNNYLQKNILDEMTYNCVNNFLTLIDKNVILVN
ncbi:MAG: hypothetical protein IJ105_04325 [Bacilli bacterium]|nr:hypothetical protein [Bacilli bacterium]